jgi:hypothetical protein
MKRGDKIAGIDFELPQQTRMAHAKKGVRKSRNASPCQLSK